eukprot:TRINITY_DN2534_c0_g1_i7.p1 TRINITY_DN2534_c0_g1~~TRINITY_DN2534_c0_g1_i7.p1  ORF type:complete len:101 (+),score=34.21 TRINITY_DN2534_c0_g1_i7:82-384(+)
MEPGTGRGRVSVDALSFFVERERERERERMGNGQMKEKITDGGECVIALCGLHSKCCWGRSKHGRWVGSDLGVVLCERERGGGKEQAWKVGSERSWSGFV